MQRGVQYQVVAHNLIALSGETVQHQVLLQFTTLANPVTKRQLFRAGLPLQEQEFDYDENVQLLQRTDFGFAADKREIQGYTRYQRGAAINVTRDVYYNAIGADGKWLTADDLGVIYNQTSRRFDGAVLRDFAAYTSGANTHMVR